MNLKNPKYEDLEPYLGREVTINEQHHGCLMMVLENSFGDMYSAVDLGRMEGDASYNLPISRGDHNPKFMFVGPKDHMCQWFSNPKTIIIHEPK